MLKNLYHLFFGIFLLLSLSVTGQARIDSLEQLLAETPPGIQKTEIQLKLAEAYLQVNVNKANVYISVLENEVHVEKDATFLIRLHIARSIYYRISGDVNIAKDAAFTALEYATAHKDSIRFKSKIYNSLGAIADDESDVEAAIEYHLIALRYAESINFESQIATICNGIGRAYEYLSEYSIAKKYYLRAISIKERNNEYDIHLSRMYINLSSCFNAEGKYNEALLYLDKSIALTKKYNNILDLSAAYNNKAYTLLLMKNYPEAEENVIIAINYSDTIENEVDKMYALSTYAEILFAQDRVAEAEEFMTTSIAMSKKSNDLYLARYNLDLMYNIYLKKRDYKKALDYFQQKSIVKDSVYNVKSRSEVEKLALEYETEKKNKEIELLNAEKEINRLDLKKSRQLQIAFLLTALLAFVVIALLWSRHKNKIKTDRLIKEALERSYEKKLTDTELQALRAQMNPHFLFNCLNSINSFIIKNEQEKASEYLSKFSMLIRKVLSNSKASKVTLADELEALELYIEMEALRFNNVFEYKITISENVEKDYLEIPPLIIQPYVENSIWHGLLHKTEGSGKLWVDIQQEEDTIICTIEDNGIGREAAEKMKNKNSIKRKSFGMNITKERLEHINEKFKDATNVTVTDLKTEEGLATGTRIVIKIAV